LASFQNFSIFADYYAIMIVADFTTIPMGTGTGASQYVLAVHELLRRSGIKFVAVPMSTAVEANSFEQLFGVIEEVNKKLANMGVKRIITSIHIDYRLDKDVSIESKLGISK
jgi:uncharacterized protein (TIGR00106 family)